MQHLVSHAEGFGKGRPLVGDAEQVLIRNNDQRIDIALQFRDAGFGQAHTMAAFEGERLGNDADGQDAAFAGTLGDDRCRAGAGAAAHASGDEDHVRTFEVLGNFGRGLLGGGHADFGMRAGPQAHGDAHAQLDALIGTRELQLLCIGIGDDELDALEAGLDHVVDSVAPGPTDTEHDNARLQLHRARRRKTNSHGSG